MRSNLLLIGFSFLSISSLNNALIACRSLSSIEAVYSPAELPSGSGTKYVYWLIFSKSTPDGPALFVFEDDTVFEGEQFSPGVYLDARKGGFGAFIFNADFTDRGSVGYSCSISKICDFYPGVLTSASDFSFSLGLPDKWAPVLPAEGAETVPMVIPGAAPAEALDVDALAQEILKRLSQNELEVKPSGSPAPDPGTQPDPKPSPDPNPNLEDLDLPSLGAALTTRFPFSIPWDVVRGIKLLAAPAEAPYWEVDFLAPIAGRVGGWKGSTKVVIDMGQYEIIGQLCRWTSTIGFCLILAGGTKKLIWTA